MSHNQDSTLQDYKAILGNTQDYQLLHGFFSPTRIPEGLTDAEVKICILLFPIREKQTQGHLLPKFLPKELLPGKKMTRSRFKRGILHFLIDAL